MNLNAFFAVGIGAALGAWLRWGVGMALNPLFLPIMLGTLVANLVGGFLMGVILGVIHLSPGLSSTFRLFATTGFLGGLTTFSTFSGEAFGLIQRGDWGWLGVHIVSHVAGSLLATWAGYAMLQTLKGSY